METRPLPRPETVKRRVVKKTAVTKAAPSLIRDSLPTADLATHFFSWIADNRAAGASERYAEKVEGHARRFVWFLNREKIVRFDANAVRLFLTYVRTAHELPEGRWGEPGQTRASRKQPLCFAPVKPSYADDYDRVLRAFGNWAKNAHLLDVNPLEAVKKPIVRAGVRDTRVFSTDEVKRLLDAAKRSPYKKRDYALCLFLLDTGIRASELCGLTCADISPDNRRARIAHGKGDKARYVHWSPETGRALLAWASDYKQEPPDPVFFSVGGWHSGTALTRSGLHSILDRLGKAAKVPNASPHAFRRTFATLFIAGGGQQMALMELMGHSDLKQTRQYVQWAGVDLATQARTYSPVASLKKKKSY